MRFRSLVIFLAMVLISGLALAKQPKYVRCEPPQARTGLEETVAPPTVTVRGPLRHTLDDPIGQVDTAGFTWYDEQQYTACGKQIAVDHEGYAHHVWTKGTNSTNTDRHVFYNVFEPATGTWSGDTSGLQIDAATKAGYVNVAVNNQGFAFPVFHQLLSGQTVAHAAVGCDFAARLGAFTVQDIPHYQDKKIIYPKIACDTAGNLHVTSTEGVPANFGYYAFGTPNLESDSIDWGSGFFPQDTTYYLSRVIATSYHSQRVAMAWVNFDSRAWYGMNLMLKTSEDGGSTWGEVRNITNFPPVDTTCVTAGGNIDHCNADTMRPYVDVSVLFDQNDVIHVAFTARGFYYWDETGAVGPWLHNDGQSQIWHWDEGHQEFNIVAENVGGTLDHSLGLVQTLCERPSLAIDTLTGYLYCSYQSFDTAQYSLAGFMQSDAWVSVSTTGGRTWSAGTNVTNTNGGQNTAAGACLSERDINIAQFVSGGFVHMQYELDLDAGTGINSTPEGTVTHNPIIYQRIPTDQLPARPLINPFRVLRLDSTGYPRGLDTTLAVAEHHVLKPGQFTLYQNYPNPFNPTTTIQFDLASQSVVSLKVFDVLGREVANLADHAKMNAGVQMVSFDASHLSSGVYFYRLETPSFSQTRKMVVMK